MTYPSGSSGAPGFQGGQQGSPPSTQFSQAGAGDSKLPQYLLAAVVVLGLASYLLSFGPAISDEDGEISSSTFGLDVPLLVLAGLLAAAALLPKARNYTAVVAVLSVLGFLLTISALISIPDGLSAGWALIVIVIVGGVQAIVALGALLLDAGLVTPPKPRPKYGQYQQYGGYYGQAGPQYGQQPGGPPQQSPGQPPYPQQYGYPTGGFPPAGQQPGQQAEHQSGPPTPPTGFPTYAQPPENQGDTTGAGATPEQSAPTQQVPLEKQEQQSPPPPPGPSPS